MAFDIPGGGEMQLMAYRQYLGQLGIDVSLFDLWNPRLDEHDLMHFFSTVSGSFSFCNYVKNNGFPLVVTASLWVDDSNKDDLPLTEIRAQLAIADAVVVNSDTEGEQLASVLDLPRDKFRTVYNGVESSFIEPANAGIFRNESGISGDFLLTVGTVEPRKNLIALARALKRVPDAKLVCFGNIRDQRYADEVLATAGEQLIFLGGIPHNASMLRSAMAACKGFILPSELETPSLSALEAAAQGAPLVITEVGSTREYFGDLAWYVDPKDDETVVAGIEHVLNLDHREERLRRLVQERYTWEQCLPQLVSIYHDVVS